MKSALKILVTLTATLTLVGCGGFGAAGAKGAPLEGSLDTFPTAASLGTCDRKALPTIGLCTEAVGWDYNDQEYLDILGSSCTGTGGSFTTNNCDRSGSFGTCVIAVDESNETHVTYYSPTYTADSARTACGNNGGTFYAQ